PPPALPPKKR
nr:Chain B, C3G PEPTIDE (PRO-PRO-PRO-ALA-LEU-PRO-PRO-LYS-LYS-ARG)